MHEVQVTVHIAGIGNIKREVPCDKFNDALALAVYSYKNGADKVDIVNTLTGEVEVALNGDELPYVANGVVFAM